jgi:hypothetical protein
MIAKNLSYQTILIKSNKNKKVQVTNICNIWKDRHLVAVELQRQQIWSIPAARDQAEDVIPERSDQVGDVARKGLRSFFSLTYSGMEFWTRVWNLVPG